MWSGREKMTSPEGPARSLSGTGLRTGGEETRGLSSAFGGENEGVACSLITTHSENSFSKSNVSIGEEQGCWARSPRSTAGGTGAVGMLVLGQSDDIHLFSRLEQAHQK